MQLDTLGKGVMYKIRGEWTVREVDLHPSLLSSRKALLKWLSISLGLLAPNETRSLVVDTLDAILYFNYMGSPPTFKNIYSRIVQRISRGFPSEEAIRKHIRAMVKKGLVVKDGKRYILNYPPLDPDDPAGYVDMYFSKVLSVKEHIKRAATSLYSLYKI